MRILFDKNVPVGVRSFLSGHDVSSFVDTKWDPRLENGELLKAGEEAGFDVMVTSDQNIRYQQNLKGRRLGLGGSGFQYLANSAGAWSDDPGQSQWGHPWKL